MLSDNVAVAVDRSVRFDHLGLYVYARREGRLFSVADPIVMREVQEADVGNTMMPTIILADEAGQSMIDELWRAGYRPTELPQADYVAGMKEQIAHLIRQNEKLLNHILRQEPLAMLQESRMTE